MKNLKKSFLVIGCCILSTTFFSFKSADANEVNLLSAETVNQNGYSSLEVSNQAARITALVRGAKKLWDASGKEVAKFVAYEVVTSVIIEAPQVASVDDEMNRKLANL